MRLQALSDHCAAKAMKGDRENCRKAGAQTLSPSRSLPSSF
jgi:hypothetical protein